MATPVQKSQSRRVVSVTFTPRDFTAIKKAAEEKRISVSAFLRQAGIARLVNKPMAAA